MKPKKGGHIRVDAESIAVDLRQIVNLLNIVMDDFEDNGMLEARRELTISALHVIGDHLGMLVEMQYDLADSINKAKRERRASGEGVQV